MSARGGLRRRSIRPGEVPIWVSSGRWGPRRVRVSECVAVLKAEHVYDELLLKGICRPGWRGTIWVDVHGGRPACPLVADVRPNAIWRAGRVFVRCPRCEYWATRLYVPVAGVDLRCRRCWGLSYESRSRTYGLRGTSLLASLRASLVYDETLRNRTNLRRESRTRSRQRGSPPPDGASGVRLIRFGGHLSKEEYDGHHDGAEGSPDTAELH